MMVSLLLELLRGDGGDGVRSRGTSCITTTLSDLLDATVGLRGDDLRGEDRRTEGALRGGDRERRRMTSSSTIDELPWAPPKPKHVYMSQRIRRNAATEPKTMPTIEPAGGPELSPE